MPRFVMLLIVLCITTGCSRLRFVIDAVPADEDLVETTVLQDEGAGRLFETDSKIAMIDVSGLIIDMEQSSLLMRRENPVARFAEALRKAEEDRDVRALIVRINSPGGTVTASAVVYRELLHFREQSTKPVVILMADVAASGGYYLACAGDEIIAHPTTVTGSIGVLMQTFNFAEGMRRIGIRADAITSGSNKSMGSPFEPMPPEHRELLQGIVNEFYQSFLAVVETERPELSAEDLAWITDGRVVTGARAAEVGLIDRVGDLRDAFEAAKQRAGLMHARLVKYHRPLDHVASPYAAAPLAAPQANLVQLNVAAPMLGDNVGFYYLWDPMVW